MSKLPTYIGVGAAILIFGGAIVYGIMTRADRTPASIAPSVKEVAAPPPPRTVPAGAREYRADEYHFSLLYPDAFTATEHEEEGGARTITFENADETQGFELFIVPYGEKTITPERLQRDIPSGVVADQTSITIDGVPGTFFYSKNYALGETREAWFIYNGYLYEMMAPKKFGPLIEDVLRTWDFF